MMQMKETCIKENSSPENEDEKKQYQKKHCAC